MNNRHTEETMIHRTIHNLGILACAVAVALPAVLLLIEGSKP